MVVSHIYQDSVQNCKIVILGQRLRSKALCQSISILNKLLPVTGMKHNNVILILLQFYQLQ